LYSLHSFPTRRSSDLDLAGSIAGKVMFGLPENVQENPSLATASAEINSGFDKTRMQLTSLEKYAQLSSIVEHIVLRMLAAYESRSEEHTSELQSPCNL